MQALFILEPNVQGKHSPYFQYFLLFCLDWAFNFVFAFFSKWLSASWEEQLLWVLQSLKRLRALSSSSFVTNFRMRYKLQKSHLVNTSNEILAKRKVPSQYVSEKQIINVISIKAIFSIYFLILFLRWYLEAKTSSCTPLLFQKQLVKPLPFCLYAALIFLFKKTILPKT